MCRGCRGGGVQVMVEPCHRQVRGRARWSARDGLPRPPGGGGGGGVRGGGVVVSVCIVPR